MTAVPERDVAVAPTKPDASGRIRRLETRRSAYTEWMAIWDADIIRRNDNQTKLRAVRLARDANQTAAIALQVTGKGVLPLDRPIADKMPADIAAHMIDEEIDIAVRKSDIEIPQEQFIGRIAAIRRAMNAGLGAAGAARERSTMLLN